ncbi:MAG TPA: membrane protein insertase YidC [Steroidobacteraceae bacterium]|nr:membrane protein insertase YidC [Steroidobacteraceae bacterium]
MTNNIRVFLWLSLLLALWLNYSQWQIDYGPKPALADTSTAADGSTSAPKPAALEDTIPQADQTKPAAALPAEGSVPVPATESAVPAPVETAGKIRVTTDVLILDIDLKGGTLVYAALPGYPLVKGEPDPVVLFNLDGPTTNYILQTGLSGVKADDLRPTHLQTFSSEATRYDLGAGQDEMRVPLTWTDGQGVTVTKTFVFHRSMFAIGIEYAIDNKSSAPWTVHSYARISRSDPKIESSMFNFKPESLAYRGPVIYDGKKYQKLDIEKSEHQQLTQQVTHGWIAGMQHHFVSAIVPNAERTYTYSLRAQGRQYLLGALGPPEVVAPNTTGTIKESIFVGPKLQKQLDTLHPELSRVADYGVLTLLSRPLFWLLEHAHSLVRNWGLAIILVTLLLKLLFYPLSEKSGRSMARMRTLAPRMKILQETYKDDRSKLGQATMELYKTEKVNPLAGCLPMLIQMPVFLAFYWVLVESAEMRQAPFLGWINDLSSRDPYFILPVLNGLAMWGQSKLNPPPPDPVQARIFQLMPIVFSVMFAFFPAGLVLYWVTNTGLTILQQWNINRKIEAEDRARKK